MNENRCHCKAPAPWLLRIVPKSTSSKGGSSNVYAVDSWAACDEHVAEAARKLIARNNMSANLLVLRDET